MQDPEPNADWPSLGEASRHAQVLYDAGAPLFTKEILRQCADQIDAFCAGQEVTFVTAGLDGVAVKAPQSMRRPNPFQGTVDTEYVAQRPKLRYHPIQALTTYREARDFKPHAPYLTTEVTFPMEEIYTRSKVSVLNPPVYSAEDLQQVLQEGRSWETSPQFQQFRRILGSKFVPSDINKIVAFGFGSLTHRGALNDTPIHQHILMLLLRDLVFPNNEVSCFAQDPAYSEADIKALATVGVNVVDDPRAFLEVDERTIVLSFSPNAPVKQVVADISRPGVIIWMFGSVQHPSYV
ncbi:hypothetical protein ACHAQA_004372 [Verticillium albo-atrum]